MSRDRHNWESDLGGLQVCMRLEEKTEPFDCGQQVELKFSLAACHGLTGGGVQLRMPPEQAKLYFVGGVCGCG